MNLSSESLARISAQHPWRTIGVWIIVLVSAFVLVATILGHGLTTEFSYSNNPDSKRADKLLEERLRGPRRVNEIVIVRSETLVVDDQGFKDEVERMYGEIASLGSGVIQGGVNYYQKGDETLVSADRHTTIMHFIMAGTYDDATTNIENVMEVVDRADEAEVFNVLIAGEASIASESNEIAEQDLAKAEGIGIPVAFIILILVFGAVAAASLPIVLAAFSIAIALGAAALVGQVFQLSFFVTNMITMIGLAVGVDYSLFIVSRFKEERRQGLDKIDAISRAGATASRTVFFSGVTVVLALVGMLVIPTNIFQSLGLGAIMVVIVTVLASLTLLPAILDLMGDKVNSWRIPFIGRRLELSGSEQGGGFWDWATRVVMKRPLVSLVIAAGLLIAAAYPFLDLNTGFNGVSTMPDGLRTKEAFLLLEKEFSFGLVSPAEIVIDGDIGSQPVQAGIEILKGFLESDPTFIGSALLQVNPAGDLALLSVPVAGEPAADVAVDAVRRLRKEYIPEAFSGTGAEALVTGAPAFNLDFYEITDTYTPIVFAVVLGLSFILLTLVFRSIVVPIKAIIMNLLSVGAAYGLMVLVFQKGVGNSLMGFQRTEIIDAWIPLFLFSVLFGLSMDYHVFLLSRIRERFDQTQDNTGSVAYGLRSTAGLITGAALIMVAVFMGFAAGDLVMFQQVGFGLAVAVFLDATIVRSVLVPASMRLLGNLNWYLPSGLDWLPDMRVEPVEPAEAMVPGN